MNGATGLSAMRITGIFDPPAVAKDALPEGSIVRLDKVTNSYENHDVRLPRAVQDEFYPGITMEGGGPTAGSGVPTTQNPDPINIQCLGLGKVMQAPNQVVVNGDPLTANTSGQAVPRTRFLASGPCIGVAYQDRTTGADPLPVEALLLPHYVEVVQQVTGSSAGTPGAATKYLPAPGGTLGNSQIDLFVCRAAASIRHLSASLRTAPGGADTVVYTVQKSSDNGATWVDTALTCTISAAGKAASDLTHVVTVAAGDLLAIKAVSSAGTAAGPAATFSVT